MKTFFSFLLLTLSFTLMKAQNLYFPPTVGNTWTSVTPASLGWCDDKVDTLLNYLEQRNTKAFLVLQDGKIVIEKYFGTFTQDSSWYWASAGKTLTAFAVGIAQQEGFLSLQDTSSQYLGQGWTSCTPAQEEKITVRNQLTMTSGLNPLIFDCTDPACLLYSADASTRWAYHNAPYTLLDGVIENATGQTLNNYVTQKIKTPTGMTGVFVPNGFNNVFVSKPRSMARFGLLLLNKGKWANTPVLTDSLYFQQMTNSSQNLNLSYGYLTWLNGKSSYMLPDGQTVYNGTLCPSAPADMFAAMGKNGQFLNVVPSRNLVFVRMGNAPDTSYVPNAFNDTIWMKLNDVFCSSTANQPFMAEMIQVFPNPAKESFSVEFPRVFSLSVHDMQGRVLLEISHCEDKEIINCSNWAKGLYNLNLQDAEGRRYIRRLLIE